MNISKFCRDNDALIDKITDVLQDHKASAEQGEQVLLLIAGMSVGWRGATVTGDWLEIVALAYQIAANEPH